MFFFVWVDADGITIENNHSSFSVVEKNNDSNLDQIFQEVNTLFWHIAVNLTILIWKPFLMIFNEYYLVAASGLSAGWPKSFSYLQLYLIYA